MDRKNRKTFRKEKQKEVIAMERRLNELYSIRHKAPKIPLKEPLRQGWIQYMTLRPDIARSPEGPILQRLIDMYGNVAYSRKKEFPTDAHWCERGSHYAFWSSANSNKPYFRSIPYKEFQALSEDTKRHFIENRAYWKFRKRLFWLTPEHMFYYPSLPAWKLVVKIKPYYVTSLPALMPEVDAEISYLRNKLYYVDQLWYRYGPEQHGCGGGYSCRCDYCTPQYKRAYLKREAKELVKEYENESVSDVD